MSAMASQINSLTIVYSTVFQGQIKENIKALRHWPLWGEFTWPVNSPHKGPVTWKIFPSDNVIILFGAMTFITSMITMSSAGDYKYYDENRLMNTLLLKRL